jgi:hypothetical protein
MRMRMRMMRWVTSRWPDRFVFEERGSWLWSDLQHGVEAANDDPGCSLLALSGLQSAAVSGLVRCFGFGV